MTNPKFPCLTRLIDYQLTRRLLTLVDKVEFTKDLIVGFKFGKFVKLTYKFVIDI